jgi:DNA integrity scanning protein DisA with diadenylate cyclase activity
MKAFIRDPASNINALNQIIPSLISDFAKEPKATSKQIETLIEALTSKKLIDKNDIAQVLFANS